MIIENDIFYAVKNYDGTYRIFFQKSRNFVGCFWNIDGIYCYSYDCSSYLYDHHLIELGKLLKEVNRKENSNE